MSTIPAKQLCSPFESDNETRLSPEDLNEIQQFTAQIKAATALRIPLVYAVVRREYPAIKIGTSFTLVKQASRTGRLMRFGGVNAVRLVAVTHGGRDVERKIHERLAPSRVTLDLPGLGHTEHFHFTGDVIAWVNEARAEIGLCPVTEGELLAFVTTSAA